MRSTHGQAPSHALHVVSVILFACCRTAGSALQHAKVAGWLQREGGFELERRPVQLVALQAAAGLCKIVVQLLRFSGGWLACGDGGIAQLALFRG